MELFDVVVIGSGPGSEPVWSSADGRSVAVVERALVGGACPFLACVPSKSMLRSAAVWATAADPEFAPFFLGPVDPALAYRQAVLRRDRAVHNRDDFEAAERLRRSGARLFRGHGRVVRPGEVDVGGTRIRYRDLVLATGSVPILPPIVGLQSITPWTSEQALSTAELPESLVVVGGGPVGCELGLLFAMFGTVVTMVQRADRLLPREEPAAAATLTEKLHTLDVRTLPGTTVAEVAPCGAGVRATVDIGRPIEAERLLLAVGRQPQADDLGLENLGVDVHPGAPVPVDERCRVVGVEHVWAVGDVTGIAPYTHTAEYQGQLVAANLRGEDARAHYQAIPRAVYTDPSVVAVGHTEASARDAGIAPLVAQADIGQTARAVTEGMHDGWVRLVADPAREILIGATAVGGRGEEWISELALAIRAVIPIRLLADVVRPFPTFSRVLDAPLRELAHASSRVSRISR
jgi:pyruvate/2-oxoglutarate dehydrogenase complex dihydrolipoamide dehydrogenase (E3) component